MKNYFENSYVSWNSWTPNDIIFKSNPLVKKLLPSDNILSHDTKGDRDLKMCKKTKGKKIQGYNGYYHYSRENYKGVMVQLKDLKTDYPSANIDFLDYTHKTDSVGNKIAPLDLLVYVNSFHTSWEWKKNAQGRYQKFSIGNVAPLDEGYRISIGGQGDSNPMSFQTFSEVVQISEAIRKFLIDRVVPYKMGELVA
jgi:hypothetical protein